MSLVALLALLLFAEAVPDLSPEFLQINRHPPDVWAAAVLYLAFRGRGYRIVGWAVLIGFARDAVSLDPLGTHAFVLGTIGYVFAEGKVQRGRLEGMARILLTAGGTLAASWLYLVRILPWGSEIVSAAAFVEAIPGAVWTALLAAGLFPTLDRFHLLDELCGRTRAFPA